LFDCSIVPLFTTTHYSQLKAHNSQLTAHSSQKLFLCSFVSDVRIRSSGCSTSHIQ